jgi:ankyrin repeat protein
MKQGCALSLAVWALSGYAYWYFLHALFLPPLNWIVPVSLGLLMAVAVGALQTAMKSAVEAIRTGSSSVSPGIIEPPKDGEVITVAGHIRAVGASLRAPFSGKPAVLYSYEIQHYGSQGGGESGIVKDYSGFALNPCAVDTPRGPIRILGFPMLEGFAKELMASDVATSNAVAYLGSTEFADMTGLKVRAMYREIKDLMTDDDGQVRKDWRMTDDPDVADKSLYEQIVSPGEQVCVIGRYSAEKRGVVPDVAHGNPLRLVQGDLRAATGSAWRKTASNLIGFAVVTLLVNYGAYSVYKKMSGHVPVGIPQTRFVSIEDKQEYERVVRAGNIEAMEKMVGRGMPVDVANEDGATPLAYARDLKTAQWLIAHGASVNTRTHRGQTPLMEQSSAGRADVVALLIKSGADLDAKEPEYKTTALMQALNNEKADVVELLRKAGAHDDTVTAEKGTPIDAKSEPAKVCVQWLDAVQHSDLATLKKISTFEKLDGVDFKAWQGARPAHVIKVSGFASDDTATVSVRGPVPSGQWYCTWTYQLVHRDGVWKISDERWETKEDSQKL